MTPERRRELKQIYRQAIRNATPQETRRHWRLYLKALYLENDDYRIFAELRARARWNGAGIDRALLAGTLTPRQAFRQIRRDCADVYAEALNRFDLATIDIEGAAYLQLTREMALQVLQAFRDVDVQDDSAVCHAMAKTWHQFARALHAQHGLPSPRTMRRDTPSDSDAEEVVVESDDFETTMTPEERAAWEAAVA